MARIGKWKQVKIGYASPGGTPFFACGACGGSRTGFEFMGGRQ